MRLHWRDLGTPRADRADGKSVELAGFPLTALTTPTADFFLMMAEPVCCQGCGPANRLAVVEVDQLGLPGGSALPSYADLPQLAAALRGRFTPEETAKLLGGNYRRVFAASMPS